MIKHPDKSEEFFLQGFSKVYLANPGLSKSSPRSEGQWKLTQTARRVWPKGPRRKSNKTLPRRSPWVRASPPSQPGPHAHTALHVALGDAGLGTGWTSSSLHVSQSPQPQQNLAGRFVMPCSTFGWILWSFKATVKVSGPGIQTSDIFFPPLAGPEWPNLFLFAAGTLAFRTR